MTKCEDPHDALAGPRRTAEHWITIWESELACLATDREAREAWLALTAFWAAGARSAAALLPDWPPASDPTSGGSAGPGAQARPPPAAAAPDARDAALARLAERVAQLERRLATSVADPSP